MTQIPNTPKGSEKIPSLWKDLHCFLWPCCALRWQFPDVSRPETLEKRYLRRMLKAQMQLLKVRPRDLCREKLSLFLEDGMIMMMMMMMMMMPMPLPWNLSSFPVVCISNHRSKSNPQNDEKIFFTVFFCQSSCSCPPGGAGDGAAPAFKRQRDVAHVVVRGRGELQTFCWLRLSTQKRINRSSWIQEVSCHAFLGGVTFGEGLNSLLPALFVQGIKLPRSLRPPSQTHSRSMRCVGQGSLDGLGGFSNEELTRGSNNG